MTSTNETNGNTAAINGNVGHLDYVNFRNVVSGKLIDTKNHRHGTNPASKQPLHEVPIATKKDLDDAVEAARAAFPKWSQSTVAHRKELLLKFCDALDEQRKEFVMLLTTEQGKPLSAANVEFTYAVHWMRQIAEMELKEETIENNNERTTVIRYVPLGVVAALVPWNFPILLATGKIAPALITGNTLIIKPSPFTPYCALKLAELANTIFPPGVVQALSGDDNLGPMITSHPDIDKISFTGSSATGKLVMQSASKTLKRVTLELGGNDPAVVCADVDIEKVAPQIAAFAFMNSGQVCLCLKRIYVHKSIYNEFRAALVRTVKTFKVGDGSDEGTTHGPLQNSMQYDRVRGFFEEIERERWMVAYGGKNDDETNGYFINPTIIDNPPDTSRIVVEEPFGPIVPLLLYETEDEVVARANNTRMGLGASVWSSNVENAQKLGRRLEAGTVWINNHFDLSPTTPFGGFKESGMGVEWGLQGLKSFCNIQAVIVSNQA